MAAASCSISEVTRIVWFWGKTGKSTPKGGIARGLRDRLDLARSWISVDQVTEIVDCMEGYEIGTMGILGFGTRRAGDEMQIGAVNGGRNVVAGLTHITRIYERSSETPINTIFGEVQSKPVSLVGWVGSSVSDGGVQLVSSNRFVWVEIIQ